MSGERRVRAIAAARVIRHWVAPVNRQQRAARPQRGRAPVDDLAQVAVPEVVQQFREHDEVKAAAGPVLGQGPLLDPDAGQLLRARFGGADRGLCAIAAQQPITARREQG